MNNKFLKNGFYNAAGGIIRIGLAILTIPLLIRLIGVEEYGLWTLASSVIAIIALAEAGLATATTVFVSQDLGKEDVDGLSQTLTVTVGAMLILATLAAIALWFGAETLVNFFPKLSTEQSLTAVQALQIAGVAVWARLLQQIVVGVEQAYQRYGVMNFLITLQSVLNNLGLLVIALLGGRTVALMHYQVYLSVVSLASHICLVWSLVNKTKININLNTTRVLIILKYSLFTWLSSLGSVLFTQCDRLILGTILGTYSLGTYAAITTITSQINVLSSLSVQP
ncbi:MAG: oligosaccharide flippase family protein, partial [Gloeotrichia echinulata HAB0833]